MYCENYKFYIEKFFLHNQAERSIHSHNIAYKYTFYKAEHVLPPTEVSCILYLVHTWLMSKNTFMMHYYCPG